MIPCNMKMPPPVLGYLITRSPSITSIWSNSTQVPFSGTSPIDFDFLRDPSKYLKNPTSSLNPWSIGLKRRTFPGPALYGGSCGLFMTVDMITSFFTASW